MSDILENLAAQADAQALETPPAAPGAAAEPEQTGPTNAQVLAGAIAAGREVFCVVTKLESPRVALGDREAAHLGTLWAPVLDKYGIDLAKYLGNYATEIAAVIGTFTIVVTLRKAVIAEVAENDAKAAAAGPDGTPVHGG